MVRLSMNEMTTYRWSFEEDVSHYTAAGIPGIGVWRQKLSDFGEERGVEMLLDSGLSVSNLLWAGGFTGSDGRSYRDAVEDGLEAVRLAGQMHADCLVVYSGARAGHTANHARRLLREALRRLAGEAEQCGVDLALEPMHPGCAADWTFLTSLGDTVALLDEVGSPRAKLAFDTYHLAHDPGVLGVIGSLADRIAIVHLGDALHPPQREQNRCPLGVGNLPLRELVRELLAGGYDGFFDVELMGEDMEQACYQEVLAQSKRTFQQLVAVGEKVES